MTSIAVFGLGYVGCVSAACFAKNGHYVIGVDINQKKIDAIKQGKSPIVEPGLEPLIRAGRATGRIEVTSDATYVIAHAQLLFVCVGTPSRPNGSQDLSAVERVCTTIGQALAHREQYAVVVIRSTILPGMAQERLIPLLEKESGKHAGTDFGFCVNPEFLREGNAIADFEHPPFTLIGQLDERSGEIVAQLYSHLEAPILRVPLGVAEMVKYASNLFHALKIVFANEIGNLCQAYGIDSHQVMDIFIQDTKLNISPSYLRPGFAFGGSCLGKDARAFLHAARQRDILLPVLEAILQSNHLQVQKALEMVLREGKRKIGVVGLSFKAGTDDLRESPIVELVEQLIGKGFEVYIYDREVSLSRLHGTNREYIDGVIPHIGSLLCSSLEETVRPVEAVVLAKRLNQEEHKQLLQLLRPDHILFDLIRDEQIIQNFKGHYHGIAW